MRTSNLALGFMLSNKSKFSDVDQNYILPRMSNVTFHNKSSQIIDNFQIGTVYKKQYSGKFTKLDEKEQA